MLAPSNVWLNFSSCIVSGASGVKVPPAIKGSPFFRYCDFSIVGWRSRRNVKRRAIARFRSSIPDNLGRCRYTSPRHAFPMAIELSRSRTSFFFFFFKRNETKWFDSYILTAVASKPCNRLGPAASSFFKNSSISPPKIPRLNFMRWSDRYTARFVRSEK